MRYNLPGVPRRSILYEDYPGVDGYEGELILINLFEDGGYLVRRCRGSLWDESVTRFPGPSIENHPQRWEVCTWQKPTLRSTSFLSISGDTVERLYTSERRARLSNSGFQPR